MQAMTMADKIVVMHDGIVEQIGTPLDLYDKPENQFVAGFIGSPGMNFPKGPAKGNRPGRFFRPKRGKPPPPRPPPPPGGRPAGLRTPPPHFTPPRRGAHARNLVGG